MTRGIGGRLLAGVAVIVVAAAIAGGLRLAGSPGQERQRRLDARRVDDLVEIGRAVDVHHARQAALPRRLADLVDVAGSLDLADPATRQPYEYRVIDPRRYELCATFQRASEPEGSDYRAFWRHGTGRQCFQLNVRKVTP